MKISWMKLDVNILSNEKIKLIRKFPSGDSLFVLWVSILCLAMKSRIPGVLMISEGTPYTPDDLCTATDLPSKTVQMGLELFMRYGMITIDKYNTINVTNMDNYQSFDQIKKQRELNYERVKRHRNKEKQEKTENKETKMITHYTVTSNATDIELDIDKDKEKIPEKKHIYAQELQLYIRECLIKHKYINEIDTKMYTNVSDIIDNTDVLNKERVDAYFKIKNSIKKDFLNKDLKEYAADLRRKGKTLETFSPQPEYKGEAGKIDIAAYDADMKKANDEYFEHMRKKLQA